MVVTSRMLAAHTEGYPLDVRSRFWSHYYRSLRDIHTEDRPPRASEGMASQRYGGGSSSPSYNLPSYSSSTYPPILNAMSHIARPSYRQ